MNNPFKKELALISDSEMLSLTEKLIRHFPEPFWRKPASSTGKYHSASSSGEGGLVLHTKQVFWVAKTILDTNLYDANKDIVLAACLLHDGWKYGFQSQWTIKNHATLAVQEIERIVDSDGFFVFTEPGWYCLLLDCILSHNGRFTKEWDAKKPYTQEQKIVHVADMIGSRKFLTFVPGGIE
jgi:23S rRNA maturation-related 3'-5' exoribonuclease YhaM